MHPFTTAGRLTTLLALAMLAGPAHADSGFERDANGVRRDALEIFGGRVADLEIDEDGTLYAAVNSPNGLFCSADGAATWTPPPAGSDFGTASAVEVGDVPGTAWFTAGTGLFKTTDSCASYTALTGTYGAESFGRALVEAHDALLVAAGGPDVPAAIDRSTDGGATFAAVAPVPGARQIVALAASPAPGEFLALVRVGDTNVLLRSVDGGATWTDTGKSGPYTNVAVSPLDPQEIVLAGPNVVEYSVNDGVSFDDVTPVGLNRDTIDFTVDRFFVGGLWTDDGGATWHDLTAEAASADTPLFGPVVPAPGPASGWIVGSGRGVARGSADFATFTDAVQGMLGVQVNDIAQASGRKDVVFLAAHGGIARTTNYVSGDPPTWTYPIDPTGQAFEVTAVEVLDPEGQTVLAAAFQQVWRSTDGGTTWNATNANAVLGAHGDVQDFAVAPDGNVWAGFGDIDTDRGGVITSADGGVTWTDASPPVTPFVQKLLVFGDAVYAGVGRESDPDGSRRGVWKREGGAWTQLGGAIDGMMVNDLAASGTTLFAAAGDVSRGGLFASTDGGATWTDVGGTALQDARCTQTVAVDPLVPTDVYVATGCPAGAARVYESEDTGASWTLLQQGLKDEVPAAMLVDDLIVGQNTGAYEFTQLCRLQLEKKRLQATFVDAAGATVTFEFRKKRAKKFRKLGRPVVLDATGIASRAIPKARRKPGAVFRARSEACTTTERAYPAKTKKKKKKG